MSKTVYDTTSPYFSTPQTRWYLGPIKLRILPSHSSDYTIILDAKYEYRPDLLSYDLYGTPSYWWIFMTMNMDSIRDPIWDFKSGMTITVPLSSRLTNLLI